jgi:tetratricopeptide (TPR) repeat protein
MQNREAVTEPTRPGQIMLIPVPGWSRDEIVPPDCADPVLGTALWQGARDAGLWGCTSPQDRHGLFSPRADPSAFDPASPFTRALQTLQLLVREPGQVMEADVGKACADIAAIAETTGDLSLARRYAEAWAYADQTSARAAATAGQLCTRLAEYPRGEIWLQRAVRLGRMDRDWEWYIRGYLRLGSLKFNLGIYPPARRYYMRAHRMAIWSGHLSLAGKAHHDLMTICTDQGEIQRGIDHAEAVYRLYPANDPVFPYFVHDFAFLLARGGYDQNAMTLLSAALDHIPPHRQLLIRGTLARAAAALNQRSPYEEFTAQVEELASRSQEGAAAAFIRVADGSRLLELWDRAESYAARGLDIAHSRHEGQPQRLAHAVLDRVSMRDHTGSPTVPVKQDVSLLVTRFLARLRKHRLAD